MMKTADLPRERASEPDEGAHQPPGTKMPLHREQESKKLTFADDVDFSQKTSSQISSSYKDVLSQPAKELSHSDKLIWLQKRRTAGLWAQCDDCNQWRYLSDVLDRHELPKKWYCRMNTDKQYASCSVPEAPLRVHDEEDLIHSEYSAGSLVWARLAGWPWWPAMVDDCPDAEQYYWLDGFSDIPTHYNVVFFDTTEVTRAWITPDQLKPYSANKSSLKKILLKNNKKFHHRLAAAIAQADDAESRTLQNRLEKYSFIARHKGKIASPKKTKKSDLQKYQKIFKKKFNIDFPIESSESEDDMHAKSREDNKRKMNNNVILLGTPKRLRRERSRVTIVDSEKIIDITDEMEQKEAEQNISEAQRPANSEPQKLAESDLQNTETETENTADKPPNSMAAQVGSTEPYSVDNDTSATYVPENSTQPQTDYNIDMDTPSSDDFDF